MIANSLANLFSATTLSPLHPKDPAIVEMLGLGKDAVSGARVDEKRVLGLPAVMRGCNLIGNAVAKTRPLIYRRLPNGKERASDHPSWRAVTRKANRLTSAAQLRKTATVHAMLWGNGLVGLIREGADVEEMINLLPDRSGMMIVKKGRQMLEGEVFEPMDVVKYWTIVGNETRIMEPEDVLHIRGLSYTGTWGLPAVEMLRDTYGVALAAREFGGRFFGQGANASVVIYMPPGISEDQQDDFRASIKKGYQGLGRSHAAMILEEGAKVEKLTIPPDDAQFLATREFENREIALALGVQSHKLGDPTRKSFNSLEQSNQEFLDDDVDPWLQIWEDELESKTLTERQQRENTHFVEFNRKELVRTNLQAQTDRERFEREWGMRTANQLLQRNNENPIGPVGDTYLVPQNMHVLDHDGMPLVLGSAPVDAGGDQAFQALAMDRCERFIERIVQVAQARSKNGKEFLQFLDELPGWEKSPACVANLLEAATSLFVDGLSIYVDPPYKGTELHANVVAAVDAIRDDCYELIRRELNR